MEDGEEGQVEEEKQVLGSVVVVHPKAAYTVRGVLLNTLKEANTIDGLIVCKIYKDSGGAGVVWSDQPVNQIVFLTKVLELDVTEALLQARDTLG